MDPKNQGEGNKEADRNYRDRTDRFINSERGKEEIKHAGDVSPGEEAELEKAEEIGKSHAKEANNKAPSGVKRNN
jgi:hypothetical protein